MSIYIDPDKIEEMAYGLKRFSRETEEMETYIYKLVSNLIKDVDAEYSESYVREVTRELRQEIYEARQMAAEITESLNDFAREAENAASEYRYNANKQAQTIMQSTMSFVLNMPIMRALRGAYRIVRSGIQDNIAQKQGFYPDKDYATLISDSIKEGNYLNLQKYVNERDAKIASDNEKYKDAMTTGEYLVSLGYVSVREYLNSIGYTNDQITYENGEVCVTINGKKYPLDIAGIALTGGTNYADMKNIDKVLLQGNTPDYKSESGKPENNMPQGTINPPPSEYYTIEEKIQYYLSQLGFNIGLDENGNPDIDGSWGYRSRVAAIVLQNSTGITIDPNPNQETLNKLIELADSGKRYADIFKKFVPSEHPVTELPDNLNSQLPKEELDALVCFGIVKMQKSEAIAYAYLLNAVATETTLEIEKFYPYSNIAGYREYKDQVRMYAGYYLEKIRKFDHDHNSNQAADPVFDIGLGNAEEFIWKHREDFKEDQYFFDDFVGVPGSGLQLSGYGTSPHGNGVAIDLSVRDSGGGDSDYGEGYATTDEVKWLEANASRFGFKPYLQYNNETIINNEGETVKYYKETWHWNYKPLEV